MGGYEMISQSLSNFVAPTAEDTLVCGQLLLTFVILHVIIEQSLVCKFSIAEGTTKGLVLNMFQTVKS